MDATPSAAAFTNSIDLASERLGGEALLASDDFFAEKENLLKPGRGVFIPDKYTNRGKWMDGWESRRKRVPGHDWCIIKLGVPGIIYGVDIDTNHFLGNHPPYASIEACFVEQASEFDPSKQHWTEILKRSPLKHGSQNIYGISSLKQWTHLRLNIYPDGGVARFRVYGDATPNWEKIPHETKIDLALITNGGKAVACSDMFFSPMDNLLLPDPSRNMGDGWETKRRRSPGFDWVIIKLGKPGLLQQIEIDTSFFKGNYPDSCRLEGCYHTEFPIDSLNAYDITWTQIISQTKLAADKKHFLEKEIENKGPFTHVRLSIYPDGGVARLRLLGTRILDTAPALTKLQTTTPENLTEILTKCCGSSQWVEEMIKKNPLKNMSQLLETAENIWWNLPFTEWLEAFKHHPKIGDISSLREKFANTKNWASNEQEKVQQASEETLTKLAQKNKDYEEKFGYIFIVCATGKTAEEMLQILESRLPNSPYKELKIAANEQLKITKLRLKKL